MSTIYVGLIATLCLIAGLVVGFFVGGFTMGFILQEEERDGE